jgi:hypothetical protein
MGRRVPGSALNTRTRGVPVRGRARQPVRVAILCPFRRVDLYTHDRLAGLNDPQRAAKGIKRL